MLLHTEAAYYFELLSRIPLYGYITIFSVQLLMEIWVVSSFDHFQQSCYEHSHTIHCEDICFIFSWVNT